MQTSFIKQAVKDFVARDRVVGLYFDLDRVAENAQFLGSLAGSGVNFLFPVKSFPHPSVLETVSLHFNGFDVSNSNEWELVKPILKKDDVIWVSAPYATPLIGSQGHFYDIQNLEAQTATIGIKSLRISTNFFDDRNSRFGTDIRDLDLAKLANSGVTAIHVHYGSEEATLTDFLKLVEILAEKLRDWPMISHVNLGGGFARLSRLDWVDFIKAVRSSLAGKEVYCEPGRWLSSAAGICIGKVLDINQRQDVAVVVTSISRDCHVKWLSDRFRLRFMPQLENASKILGRILLAGPTCDEKDYLAEVNRPASGVAVGDLVILEDISGYSYAWNHSFNGIQPAEIIFHSEQR